ncbi:type II and III secretion system protein:NolW [Caminibacter mediatlanticus TB-2]|uniref:Type II and III secretion system protein:NolW n=1 Tax=Caminibacter mediatlanticus TB-2 TaxID=391592 RepID=A0AAI9F243_9BACT|nr:secretin N-terminal domain-containing protein [Caminibacter mediatlanticus]EDM23418.1 type II and III secretion system protein:NolW-like protein [Caminibacter mediatlanticus TB-2]QCT93667.1 type II and III secretion system protein:NolW [Caminibacter mediatlanticus TB-2]
MKLIKILFLTIIILNAKVNLNFQNLDINDFIKMVAKITNKNILITQPISGKVNFVSVKPIDEKEVYSILLNILRSRGYTIIKDNGFLKVIRESQAIKEGPQLNPHFDQIQTNIIKLNNIPVRNAFNAVAYLKSNYGRIVINSDKNMLIVTDYPSNLKVIKEVLKRIDSKETKSLRNITLNNTSIDKVYPKLNQIATTLFNTKIYSYKIIPNDVSNSIILVGQKNVVYKLARVVKSLDVKPKQLNQITKVITLKNSDATNIAKILQNIVKTKYKKNPPSITLDKETNSIIILATPEQIETIKTIINALDTPKEQVYVKARILEISNTKAAQIGNRLGLYAGSGTTSGLYTLSANLGGPAIAFDVASLGLTIPTIKQGIALGATLDLLETYGAAKKLSEPSILCINNTPSTIYVGKTVSVLTGKTTSTTTSESYTRQDIGLTLKVKPRIDSDNKVALNVDAVIEDLLPGSPVNMPITSKRTINTTTIVRNGQSIIIGGLVRDNKDITLNKVPLLGDIPILGALFRHKQINKDKTTLVIVLTPYIVKKSDDLEKLRSTLVKLNELEKKFVKNLKKKLNEKNK